MIPKAYIARWRDVAPWSNDDYVEQDLIISRALIAIFSDGFLKENLAFRGGTALHKLYLNPAPRYSEDIDLVQIKAGPIKPILDQIEEVITFFEEKRSVKQKANNNTILYKFISETGTRLRLKLEINCREHFNLLGWESFLFNMNNEWFSGECEITTYKLEELLGTKLRALYQRKKGRDLFDLYHADKHKNADVDWEQVIHCYKKYMNFVVGKPPTAKQFLRNLDEKKSSDLFHGDLEGLLRTGVDYDQEEAFDWVVKNLIYTLSQ
ncbi:MAG: nucleotidyl transferase AbiEii/AbiGii toxin family protein [Cytophagales bacterium]|nr:nucleotidyl transferase AbiEii/AbiGii toxin family protein [Cytophagales bacterium]